MNNKTLEKRDFEAFSIPHPKKKKSNKKGIDETFC